MIALHFAEQTATASELGDLGQKEKESGAVPSVVISEVVESSVIIPASASSRIHDEEGTDSSDEGKGEVKGK